jgi:hypothetical protein
MRLRIYDRYADDLSHGKSECPSLYRKTLHLSIHSCLSRSEISALVLYDKPQICEKNTISSHTKSKTGLVIDTTSQPSTLRTFTLTPFESNFGLGKKKS